MIFQSVPLMTFVDLFVLGVAAYLAILWFRHRAAARRLGLSAGLGATLFGVAALACLYLVDLFSMLVMPALAGRARAMQFMTDLHLQWSWLATLLSVSAFAYGLHRLVGGLVPRLVTTLDELRAAEGELRESKVRLESEVQERTARLARTEETLRQFLNHSPDACHLKDADERYLFVNRTYEQWLGVDAATIIGRGYETFVTDPAILRQAVDMDRRVLAGEGPQREFSMLDLEGQPPRRLEVRKFPVRDESGRVTRVGTISRDVTEELEQRERTREAERRLALALAHVPDGVALFDAEDRLVICNDTWRYDLNGAVAHVLEPGCTFETYVRALLERRLLPDAVGREESWLQERLATRRAGRNVIEIRMTDGSWRLVTETVVEDGSLVLVATPITELKQREFALERSEQRFRELAQASSDWFWEMDPDLRFSYLSPGFEEKVGIAPEAVLGRHREDFPGASRDLAPWTRHFADLEARRPFRYFEYATTVNGETHHFRVSGVPIFDERGTFQGYRGVGADISESVAAERALASAEERLVAAIESVPDAYAVFDEDDRLVICNEAYRRMHLASVGEEIELGMTFREILEAVVGQAAVRESQAHPDEWIERRMRAHASPGSGYHAVTLRNGRNLQVSETRTRFDDTVLVARDVTDLRLAEAERDRLRQQLQAAVEQSPAGIILTGQPEPRLRVFNQAAVDILAPGDDPPTDMAWLETPPYPWAMVDEDGRELPRAEAPLAKAERDGTVSRNLDLRVRVRSGEVRRLLLSGGPVRDENGDINGGVVVFVDVTEQRRAEAEVQRLNSELEARVEARTADLRAALDDLEAFSYSVSHDLRAPLRHVAGYLDLLDRHVRDGLDAEGGRYLDIIRHSAQHMGKLIDDLLEFSRTGWRRMKRSPIDLAEVVREVREGLTWDPARRIEWKLGDLPGLEGDPGLIRQVMMNLLSNAVKFTAGEPVAVIEVGALPDPGNPGGTAYFVRDNGVGYDARYEEKLYGVFQRLHDRSEYEGTGIGLAIVHRVIARHGGRVWSESRVGEGATFYFTVPRAGRDSL